MKKVLSLVLALVLVLGMIPTFAADATGAQALYDNGFITGKDGADLEAKLDVNAQLTRAQLAALIAELNGAKEEAAAFEQPADFTDFATIAGWAKNFVSYAAVNGWMNGFTDGTFRADASVPAQQLAAVLMNALGYDVVWNTVLADAAELGIVVEGAALTRGEAFEAMWVAVSEVMMADSEMTLGQHLGKLTPPVVVPTTLTIDSVTATNLKEVVVKFNQVVDKETVVAANFVLNKSLTSSVTLLEDGKTAVVAVTPVTTGEMGNQVEYTLTVEKVKTVAGAELAKVTKTFTAFDATLPTVVGVTYTGPKNFEIEFSEPMQVAPTVTVKSGNSTLSVNTAGMTGLGTNVITVPLFSTLTDATTYTITVTAAQDFAGYVNVIKSVEAPYAKDVTAPTAKVVKATQEYVVVEFSKPVSGLDPALFSHTFSAWKASKLTATDSYAAAAITSGTTFYVWFNGANNASIDRPIAQGTTTLNILPKSTTPAAEILDLWSNKFVEVTLPLTIVADTTAPEVKEIKIASETSLTVEFTKNVSFAVANVEVLDKDGKAITGIALSVTEASGVKKYTVNFGKNLAGETIVVNIKNVKDTTLMTNAMAAYTTTLAVTDKTAPTITKVTYDATDKYLYVFFNENMDSVSALVKDNYQIVNGTTFTKLATDPVFVNGSKTVRFTLNTTQQALILLANPETTLFIDNVKDVALNTIVTKMSGDVVAHAGAVIPAFTKAEATARDKVVVTFNEELGLIDIAAFRFNGQAAVAMDVTVVEGKTVATFTLNDAFKLAANYVTANALTVSYVDAPGAALVKNLFNVSPVHTETIVIADKIKPSILATDIVTANGEITLTFSETLDATIAATYAQDLVITKNAVAQVAGVDYVTSVAGNVITVTKVGPVDLDDAVYTVKSVDAPAYIRDAVAGNKAVAFTTAKSLTVDQTAPTATVAAGAALVITYNEALYIGGTAVANGTDIKAQYVAADGAGTTVAIGITSATYNAAAKTVTFVLTNLETLDTVTVAGTLTDMSGNSIAASSDVATYTLGTTTWALN